MTSHIVISREELRQLLKDTIVEAHEKGILHQDVDDFIVEKFAYTSSLPSGWLPISEAPKDGTWVLVAGKHGFDYTWAMNVCRWKIEENGYAQWRTDRLCLDLTTLCNPPYYFLPLIQPE